MIETTDTEQKMIDDFIRYNTKMLKRMDERNREDYFGYLSDYDCLSSDDPYERKRAVRRILTNFMADWG